MKRVCYGCGKSFGKRDNEKPKNHRKRKFCSRKCHLDSLSLHIDVHGVSMTVAEIAKLAGITPATVRKRISRGCDPLTGKAKA